MKLATTIFMILSVLSIVSGVAYLAVGFNASHERAGFSSASAVIQILLAVAVLLSSVGYNKNGDKFKMPFIVPASLYVVFIVYVVS